MKKHNTAQQQLGFFDLGFSLVILALSGSFAYAVTPDQDERVVMQEPQIEVAANLKTGDESFYLHE